NRNVNHSHAAKHDIVNNNVAISISKQTINAKSIPRMIIKMKKYMSACCIKVTSVLLRLNNGFVRGFVEKSWPGNRTCCGSTVGFCWCVVLLRVPYRTFGFGSLSMQRPGRDIEPCLQFLATQHSQAVHDSLGNRRQRPSE